MRENHEKKLVALMKLETYSLGILFFICIFYKNKTLYLILNINFLIASLTNLISFIKYKKVFWRNEVFSGKEAYPGLVVSIIIIIGSIYFLISGL